MPSWARWSASCAWRRPGWRARARPVARPTAPAPPTAGSAASRCWRRSPATPSAASSLAEAPGHVVPRPRVPRVLEDGLGLVVLHERPHAIAAVEREERRAVGDPCSLLHVV